MPPPPLSSGAGQDIQVGSRVIFHQTRGYVRFIGSTAFATGKWYGVELDEPIGRNDGSVNSQYYFRCAPKHGIFARVSQIKVRDLPSPPLSSSSSSYYGEDKAGASRLASKRSSTLGHTKRLSISSSQGTGSRIAGPSTPSTPATPGKPQAIGSRSRVGSSGSSESNSSGDGRHSRQPSSSLPSPGVSTSNRRSLRINPGAGTSLVTPTGKTPTSASHRRTSSSANRTSGIPGHRRLPSSSTSSTLPGSSTPVTTGTGGTSGMTSSANLNGSSGSHPISANPAALYQEIRMKLKILEGKRSEEKEHLKDAERVSAEGKQAVEMRAKLAAKIGEMSTELRSCKRQINELILGRDEWESKYNDVMESLEMATLNKEIAEERADSLASEVGLLKSRLDEAKIDLDAYKAIEDHAIIPGGGDGGSGIEGGGEGGTPINSELILRHPLYIQCERKVEKLTEALVRYRDVASEQEAEQHRRIKGLERERFALLEVHGQNDKLRVQIATLEGVVEELRAQLEDMEKAEELVERLSERKEQLEARVAELESEMEALEADRELNEELEEQYAAAEKQLKEEVEHQESRVRDLQRRLESTEEAVTDGEATIQQFRVLVRDLQERNEASVVGATDTAPTRGREEEVDRLERQARHSRAQGRALEQELRRMEAEELGMHLTLITPFLPQAYEGEDAKGVRTLLLLQRMGFKADLIGRHLEQVFRVNERMDGVGITKVLEMREALGRIWQWSRLLGAWGEETDVATWKRVGGLEEELGASERRLDALIKALRGEEAGLLSGSGGLDEVLGVSGHLEKLVGAYLTSHGQEGGGVRLEGWMRGLEMRLDRASWTLGCSSRLWREDEEEEKKPQRIGAFRGEFIRPLQEILGALGGIRGMSRKIGRRLEEEKERLEQEVDRERKRRKKESSTLGGEGSSPGAGGSEEALPISSALSLLYTTQEALDQLRAGVEGEAEGLVRWSERVWELLSSYVRERFGEMGEEAESCQVDATKLRSGGRRRGIREHPWEVRAREVSSQSVPATEVTRRVGALNEEISSLHREVKLRERALEEGRARVEMLESRQESLRQQANQLTQVEEELSRARVQERAFEEAIENLQSDLDRLERDNGELEKAKLAAER
ncbi:MAG: hypothetical protein DHS80DRAFT_15653, partial [Piptocephalis tieghemiana]